MRIQNIEEQKEKTYEELVNLLNLIPFKYKITRREICDLRDFLNSEKWLRAVI